MDPTIIAAIIGSAASAATTAVNAAFEGYSPGAGDMLAAVENESSKEWVLWDTWKITGTPNPGFEGTSLQAVDKPETVYEAWRDSGDVPDSVLPLPETVNGLSASTALLLKKWIMETPNTDKLTDTCRLQDNPMYVAVWHDKQRKHAIAVVIDDPQVGPKWCGVICSDMVWMRENMSAKKLSDHVKHSKEQNTEYAEEGQKETATMGEVSCTVTCGRTSKFVIKDTANL